MPKRTDIKSILILGAGPIIIGQACEFDYSGAQACKALREEGFRVILVNSNPATIMTDPSMADATYIEPVEWKTVARIIEEERPDALLPTMGGQTALNCALDLAKHGVLDKFSVEMIGANADAIDKAEDRERFDKAMKAIGLNTPNSGIAHSMEEATQVADRFGFPCIIRPSFTMGGSGGGIAYNREEFETICRRGLDLSPTNELLIDESLIGWKEFEMEVVRDKNDNCIIVCAIENLDPMGIHTGDSITVAPAQTLTDKEYQIMRNASIKVLREIGVETGGSNVQFAVSPEDGRLIVIEMNPRVSRSSALASKATGFPIARVAAKLAVGYTLNELQNEITGGATPASFEPSIDYVVTKIPRFAFEKFNQADQSLTTQMKSVGEVMAIGRTFQESLQKALRGLEVGVSGFDPKIDTDDEDHAAILFNQLAEAGPDRIWYLADAFRQGMSCEEIFGVTKIDPWFLVQIEDLIIEESRLNGSSLTSVDEKTLYRLKRKGFADRRIADILLCTETEVRNLRYDFGIHPVYKRVDTCAAEFSTETAYMYSTYEEECEAEPSDKDKILVLGGGPNRIGQGIEFDYCCVQAVFGLKELGFKTIMINCNPETVSTDFDLVDRLYFEPVTFEDVMNIVEFEKPDGVLVQFGGQTPLKISNQLADAGAPIIGTSPINIDVAEDREKFGKILNKLNISCPTYGTGKSLEEVVKVADNIGYPVLARPSYVLGGRAMEIVYSQDQLIDYITRSADVTRGHPILIDQFLENAYEFDVDALCDGEEVYIGAIMQHIEEAGIHSGDSACVLPPYQIKSQTITDIEQITSILAIELNVIGLINIQYAYKNNNLYVLEVNPRASRTTPFVSKSTNIPLAKIAAQLSVGQKLKDLNLPRWDSIKHVCIKEAVLPFNKFPAESIFLSPEMKSTGEVMGISENFGLSFYKATLSAGVQLPDSGLVFISVNDEDKFKIIPIVRGFIELGFNIIATSGTAHEIVKNGMITGTIYKAGEGRPNIVDRIKNNEVALVINTPLGPQSRYDEEAIGKACIQKSIMAITTISAADAVLRAIRTKNKIKVKSIQEYHS